MRWLAAACAALLLMALLMPPTYAQGTGTQDPDAQDAATAHIVVLGSSTAEGTGPEDPDSAWVARYRAHLQAENSAHRVTNLARGGYQTSQILPTGHAVPDNLPQPDTARNITRALALEPSAVIINLPSNDAANDVPADQQMANLEVVTERAAAAGVPVWVATPQPRNFDEPARRQIQRDLLDATEARYGSRALDFWRGLAEDDGTLRSAYDSGDGTHLNALGHALLFDRVVAAGIPGAAERAATDPLPPSDTSDHGNK